MTRILITILSIITLFAFFRQTEKRVNSVMNNDSLNLNGYWILTNYIDKIQETQSIEPQIRQRLTWDAIVFKIDNDTIETHGLIRSGKFFISKNTDSLTTLIGIGKYRLSYLPKSKTIKAVDVEEKDTLTYNFRRISEIEIRLVKNIDGKPFFMQLQQNFHSFFIENLISGTYKTLTNSKDLKVLDLFNNGKTNGFKHFNKYSIHDYFGTLHPYLGSDAIIFTDTTKVQAGNEPPDNFEVYNWNFSGDTLTLTEMKTETYESYFIGEKQYKLLRIKKHSH